MDSIPEKRVRRNANGDVVTKQRRRTIQHYMVRAMKQLCPEGTSLKQFANTPYSMEVKLSGMVKLVRAEQLKNALSPMKVTLSGMVMYVRLEHFLNAPLSMKVTLLPMETFVRAKQL